MDKCELKAYAKINLGLDVVQRLPNGYHQVRMIMQTVDIFDVLSFQKTESGIRITTNSGELPIGEDNLIYKAARMMMEEFGITEGVQIHLEKNIPIAAGMAGGSTDAAATLKGMCQLFHLDVTEKRLMELGVKIGADVPYCVMGGTALAEGIGEVLTPLDNPPACYLVVAKPDINVSTKYVYERLDAKSGYPHPDIDGMLEALKNQDLQGIAERLENVLESVTVEVHPIIDEIKGILRQQGTLGCLMSGSGPTVFGLFEDRKKAEKAAEAIRKKELARQIFVTSFV